MPIACYLNSLLLENREPTVDLTAYNVAVAMRSSRLPVGRGSGKIWFFETHCGTASACFQPRRASLMWIHSATSQLKEIDSNPSDQRHKIRPHYGLWFLYYLIKYFTITFDCNHDSFKKFSIASKDKKKIFGIITHRLNCLNVRFEQ